MAKGRKDKYLRKRLVKPDSSHRMGRWHTDIRCPASTPRFYTCRECVKCGEGQMYHAAGIFNDPGLSEECQGDT